MVQSVRGMRDVMPADARLWRGVEDAARKVLTRFGYEEVQLPLLEQTELFARSVGESTDIVEKEMYILNDRDGESLALRPEGTAGCVRALNEQGLLYNQTQRVFYAGPMFRYERPQKGRYRQFSQIGAEAFGFPGPDLDAELIHICSEFWRALGVAEHITLQLNTLGSAESRRAHREALVAFLTPLREQLDEDSQRRLTTNPLRILDSKDSNTQAIVAEAPQLMDFLDDQGRAHFEQLCRHLDGIGQNYEINQNLVRGLDYYTHTVFEWVTTELGAQGTVCGGGRYDGLVEQLGGKATPAAGFGMGLDRAVLLCEAVSNNRWGHAVDVYICYAQDDMFVAASQLAQRLRQHDLQVRTHLGGGGFKKQLKRANSADANWAVLLGEDELQNGQITVKHLGTGEQQTLVESEAIERLLQS